MREHGDGVTTAAITPNGQCALLLDRDGMLNVWKIDHRKTMWGDMQWKRLYSLPGHSDTITAMLIMSDGQSMLSSSSDQTLKLWNLENRTVRLSINNPVPIRTMAVAHDGLWAITNGDLADLRGWNLESGNNLFVLQGGHINYERHECERVTAIQVISKQKVITGLDNGVLRIWEIESKQEIAALLGHSQAITALVLTPDYERVISASKDTTLKIWDLENNLEIMSLRGHEESISDVAVLPDSKHAISVSFDHTLRLWDLESGTELYRLIDPNSWINAVKITQDGKWAILAASDNTLKIWDLSDRKVIACFSGDHAFNACAVNQDKTMIVVGDWSGQIHFLRLVGAGKDENVKFHCSTP
jgi:WD40 repeat protein